MGYLKCVRCFCMHHLGHPPAKHLLTAEHPHQSMLPLLLLQLTYALAAGASAGALAGADLEGDVGGGNRHGLHNMQHMLAGLDLFPVLCCLLHHWHAQGVAPPGGGTRQQHAP